MNACMKTTNTIFEYLNAAEDIAVMKRSISINSMGSRGRSYEFDPGYATANCE